MFPLFYYNFSRAIDATLEKEKRRAKTVWKGIALDEAFEDRRIYGLVEVVSKKVKKTEAKYGTNLFHVNCIEVEEQNLQNVLEVASYTLFTGWYLYVVREDVLKIVFRGKIFEITKGNDAQLQQVREYATELGLTEQLQLQRMFYNPFLD